METHLNTELTKADLETMEYDTLIFATGALPKLFGLGEGVPVIDAKTALRSAGEGLGDNITIIGGGMVGCELALWLRKDLGKNVTIVEALHKLLAVNAPICSANRDMLEKLIPFHGCDVRVKTAAVKVTDTGIILKALETNEESEVPTDTVILAVGFKEDKALFDQMQDADEIYAIGDCRQFKNVHQAVWDACEVANHL